jgi:superfamily I DNA and RNA helicase
LHFKFELAEIKPCFDVIFIDEGQDLIVGKDYKFNDYQPIYWLAWQSLRPVNPKNPDMRRLYWAYDEFQTLDKKTMVIPEFKEIFGTELSSKILKKSEVGEISKVMKCCYRTPNAILLASLALGLGLLRDKGRLYPLDKEELNNIGFEVEGDFRRRNEIKIWRNPANSQNKIDQIYHGKLIEYEYFDDMDKQIEGLIKKVQFVSDLEFNERNNIMIVALGVGKKVSNLVDRIGHKFQQHQMNNKSQLNFFIPGKSDINQVSGKSDASTFWKDNAITITHIYRAKGNEADWVFIVAPIQI